MQLEVALHYLLPIVFLRMTVTSLCVPLVVECARNTVCNTRTNLVAKPSPTLLQRA